MDFAHLENVWDWKLMKDQCKMPHIKYMHRIHALCFFRVGDTIAVKWKHYLTSPDWSRPVVIVPAHLAKGIADWRPPRIPQQFDQKFVTSHLTWLHKLGVALAETPSASHQQDLEHLAAIVTGQVRYDPINLDTLITDLKRCHSQQQANDMADRRMADDQLVQLFPGADYPEMPADALIEIPDRWAPKRPPVITPDSMIICVATAMVCQLRLPFLLASVAGPMGPADNLEQLIVQWWVPPIGQISTRQGRAKDAVDIFGSWRSAGALTLKEAADVELPSVVIDRSTVLMGPVDLIDSRLTYQDLDKLIDQHKVDVTGLTWTQTKNGNAFRLYRLMK